jgi:predicted FMN-binding regulatory protein PaiB
MTRTQRKNEIARLVRLLETQKAAHEHAWANGPADYFYQLCDSIPAIEWEIQELEFGRRKVDSNTRALISANID